MKQINRTGYLVMDGCKSLEPRTYACASRVSLDALILHLTSRTAASYPLDRRGLPCIPGISIAHPFHIWDVHPLNALSARCHEANKTWWHDPATGAPIQRNKGEMLALIHSEISECLEGVRKNLQDDHLPQHRMEVVELADALVRIFDYAGGFGLDLGAAFEDKMAYNAQRADHKPENRVKDGGKVF